MQISAISTFYYPKQNNIIKKQNSLNMVTFGVRAHTSSPIKTDIFPNQMSDAYSHFTTIPDIEYEEYVAEYKGNPAKRKRMRWKCEHYQELIANKNNMPDKKYSSLPLMDEKTMKNFIETSKIYCKYKDQPIICLGRSPKWFLNTALWMKDGIPDYKFVAFSGYWYRPDPVEGVVQLREQAKRDDVIDNYLELFSKVSVDSNEEFDVTKTLLKFASEKEINDEVVANYKLYTAQIEHAPDADKRQIITDILYPITNLPTKEEIAEYRKYLKRIKADPASIVAQMQETGKKTVITDYICTGKGFTSFLDIMGHYAEKQNVLEAFSKSIEIVGIGSMEYMEHLNPYLEEYSTPKVIMPPILCKYDSNIKQTYYDIEDFSVFEGMLLNQNTNECRSTFYPHWAWRLYKPDKFKTGMTPVRSVTKLLAQHSQKGRECFYSFAPEMRDFRNLLNFKILDALNESGKLKLMHITKI